MPLGLNPPRSLQLVKSSCLNPTPLFISTSSFLPRPAAFSPRCNITGGSSRISWRRFQKLDCLPIIIGGVDDHVHILARNARTITQADWVKELKRASSLWIKERDPSLRDFAWQSGYGIFSVSHSNLETIEHYIANQEEHHKKTTFQDEYRSFLKRHGIPWDEKYVWD